MEQKQELDPLAKVAFESLKEANPDLPEEELKKIARAASEAAAEQFGKMVEAGADPWTVREQLLDDLSHLGSPQEPKDGLNM